MQDTMARQRSGMEDKRYYAPQNQKSCKLLISKEYKHFKRMADLSSGYSNALTTQSDLKHPFT